MTASTEQYLSPVLLTGENPNLFLYRDAALHTDLVGAASYWWVSSSIWGPGQLLVLRVPELVVVLADNSALAQEVVARIVRYFGEFADIDLASVRPLRARLHREVESGNYRVRCEWQDRAVTLRWGEPGTAELVMSEQTFGPRRYHVSSVIAACASGVIEVDGQRVSGAPRWDHAAKGAGRSSVFLAFSEVWVPLDSHDAEPLLIQPAETR